MDQEDRNPEFSSQWVAWLFLCFGVFVIVTGYLANFISTDSMTSYRPRNIENLEDQLSSDFQLVRPMILGNLPFYSVLKEVKEGTLFHRLFKLLHRDVVDQLMMLDFEKHEENLSLMSRLQSSFATTFNASLIYPVFLFETFLPDDR